MAPTQHHISAVVVAGGLSSRMGTSKQLLPYGPHTVIEHIVDVLLACPLDEIVVVTGHTRDELEALLEPWPVCCVVNPDYEVGEMLSSVQRGLAALGSDADAALLALGDQPQIEAGVVRELVEAYQRTHASLVIPSFEMQRGHPILVDRRHWDAILALDWDRALRDVINAHADRIHYVTVATDSILRDIDTAEEYAQALRRLPTAGHDADEDSNQGT
jgi:molybdenum cofactor cytidylyltransferase